MSSRKRPDMRFMSDAAGQNTDIRACSDNGPQPEESALTELSLVLLDHGIPAVEVKSAIDQLSVLTADHRAGRLTKDHLDRVAEIILATTLARARKARAA